MNSNITLFLRTIGLRATYTGFSRLTYAIALVLNDESYLHNLTTRLYPAVASKFQVSVPCVERSMRTVLEVFWDRGNIALLEKMLGYHLPDRPYIGEFIDIIASYLRDREPQRIP